MEAEAYEGWTICTDYSGDIVFPRQATAIRDGEHSLHAIGQTDREAIDRLKAQIDLAERMGS